MRLQMKLRPCKRCLSWFSCGSSILVELEFGVLVFVEGGKLENRRRKTLRARMRTNNKLNPHMTPGQNWTRATLVVGERSHHCTIPTPCLSYLFTCTVINPLTPVPAVTHFNEHWPFFHFWCNHLQSAYEMKNYLCLFERPFELQKNGVFLLEISFFVLEILTFFYYAN